MAGIDIESDAAHLPGLHQNNESFGYPVHLDRLAVHYPERRGGLGGGKVRSWRTYTRGAISTSQLRAQQVGMRAF